MGESSFYTSEGGWTADGLAEQRRRAALPIWLQRWTCPACDQEVHGAPCECDDIQRAIEAAATVPIEEK